MSAPPSTSTFVWRTQVYLRVNFLLDNGFRVSRDDLQLFHTTYNWPHNIKTYLARSAELQRSRKQDLEMVVEGQQEQLLREVCISQMVIDIIRFYILAPSEY